MTAPEATRGELEELADGSFRRFIRLYVERLAFTARGHFAFLAANILLLQFQNQSLLYGVNWVDSVTYAGQYDGLPAMALGLLNGGVTLLTAVLAGVAVLLVLDIYEAETGRVIDTESLGEKEEAES